MYGSARHVFKCTNLRLKKKKKNPENISSHNIFQIKEILFYIVWILDKIENQHPFYAYLPNSAKKPQKPLMRLQLAQG